MPMLEDRNRYQKHYKDRINEIKQSIADGAKSVGEISLRNNLAISTIRRYASKEGIKLPKRNLKRENIEKIMELANDRTKCAENIADELGLSVLTVMKYSSEAKIKRPPYMDTINRHKYKLKRDKKRDRLIRRGFPLTMLAEKFGDSLQNNAHYISKTGQYEIWKESRKYYGTKQSKERKRKEMLGILVSQIEEIIRKKVPEKDKLAYEKTEEFFKVRKRRKFSFDEIFSLFKDYFNAQRKNKKITLENFADKYGYWITNVGRFFKDVGLKPLFNPDRKKRVPLSKYKKQALERSLSIKMPIKDRLYFLNLLSENRTTFYYYRRDKKIPDEINPIKRFGVFRREILMYENASQIYEARDVGFKKPEILELVNLDERVYDYAIEHEQEISGHIISSLKTMFPDKPVKNPYVDFSINS